MSAAEMASNAGEMTKVLHDLRGTIYFVIMQVRPPENGKKNCTLVGTVGYSRLFHASKALFPFPLVDTLLFSKNSI
jgi:hypothetical protein